MCLHCSKAIVSVIDLPHIASRVTVAKLGGSHGGGYSPFNPSIFKELRQILMIHGRPIADEVDVKAAIVC